MGSTTSCIRPQSTERTKRRIGRNRSNGVSLATETSTKSNTSITSDKVSDMHGLEKKDTAIYAEGKSNNGLFISAGRTESHIGEENRDAYDKFISEYPEYRHTAILDDLRTKEYSRLSICGETYVDYMGGALYPESLVKMHSDFLTRNILGNTHSVSNSSTLSVHCADEARKAVLKHFNAPPEEYTVVFTSNASGALKLVGESFPFASGSKLVIGEDSHNSIHGIREFAGYKGAETVYIPTTSRGGFDPATAKDILHNHHPKSDPTPAPSLFILTAQSNITNSKSPLSITQHTASLGYYTVVDAAALAATSLININEYPIDAMAVSFYKMFGYPTGVGALIAKKRFLAELKRPWFAGGTVDVVQVPGRLFTRVQAPHEQFEDGTINYLQLSAITNGLDFLEKYLPYLPLRLSILLSYLAESLGNLRHDSTGAPVLQILSKLPNQRLTSVGEQSDAGSVLSLVFLDPRGSFLPNSFIEYAASTQNISLRTGCMCNTGGAAAMLGLTSEMQTLFSGITSVDLEKQLGRELGVVRVSLGLASNFEDVRKVVKFASLIGEQKSRDVLWRKWRELEKSKVH